MCSLQSYQLVSHVEGPLIIVNMLHINRKSATYRRSHSDGSPILKRSPSSGQRKPSYVIEYYPSKGIATRESLSQNLFKKKIFSSSLEEGSPASSSATDSMSDSSSSSSSFIPLPVASSPDASSPSTSSGDHPTTSKVILRRVESEKPFISHSLKIQCPAIDATLR